MSPLQSDPPGPDRTEPAQTRRGVPDGSNRAAAPGRHADTGSVDARPADPRSTDARAAATRSTADSRPRTAGVSPGSTFAPISLRPAIDAAAVQERLDRLGAGRSTAAVAERAELLRALGRLDEALVAAEEGFRLALFTGDRADGVSARIRRAHVLHDLGRLDRAVAEAATARGTAAIEEWHELEGAAAELEGWSLYELGRHEEARAALTAAHEAFRAAGASIERTSALQTAIEESMRPFQP